MTLLTLQLFNFLAFAGCTFSSDPTESSGLVSREVSDRSFCAILLWLMELETVMIGANHSLTFACHAPSLAVWLILPASQETSLCAAPTVPPGIVLLPTYDLYHIFIRVTAAVLIMTKSKIGNKGFIWLTLPHCSSSLKKSGQELKQGRNLETGTEEAMKECCLLTCSSWLDCLGLFF